MITRNKEALKQVRDGVNTPSAADEDLIGLDTARRILQYRAALLLVLKPTVIGRLRLVRRIMELACTADVAVMVTTSLDTGRVSQRHSPWRRRYRRLGPYRD